MRTGVVLEKPNVGFFREHGYQIFRDVVPTDVLNHLRSFSEAQVDQMMDELSALGVKSDPSKAAGDIIRLLSTRSSEISHELRVRMTGHFSTESRLSKDFWLVARVPQIRCILQSVLKSDRLRMHMPPMARFVLPNNTEAGVPAHQDASYNSHMTDFVTLWMPLVEIDDECGGVIVYEGRKEGVLPALTRVDHGIWLKGISTDGLRPVRCVPMSPGDLLIFNPFVVHESMPNLSQKIRFSLDYRFLGERAVTTKHYLDLDTWIVHDPPPEKGNVQ
jgi:ectoine hydroxylase-related dioxygenase (phytanoyl-CoA dioxygenase family)